MYENNQTKTLNPELFRNPTAEYRGAPFWAWNCALDRQTLLEQIDVLHHMGFGGFHITLKGLWKPTLYDTHSGETEALCCQYRGGNTVFSRGLWDHDSLLVLLEPGEQAIKAHAQNDRAETPVSIGHSLPYTLSEPNVLLLDVAESRLDDGPWKPAEELLRVDSALRKELGWVHNDAQPWAVSDEPAGHTVTLRFKIVSEPPLSGVLLAIEQGGQAKLTLNGNAVESRAAGWFTDKAIKTIALPALKAGENTLTAEFPFHQNSNIEWCYLLGSFGVRLRGRDAALTGMPQTLAFGDCTAQGLAFYGANVTYHAAFCCDGGDVRVHIPKYRGSLLRVTLDGNQSGVIAYAPYDFVFYGVAAGGHRLDITLYGNRFNSFGGLHNANDNLYWKGPNAWRQTGDSWCYEYNLRPFGILTTPTVTLLK